MSIPNCTWFSQLYWYNSAETSYDTAFCCLQRKSSPARPNIGSKQTGSAEVRFCAHPFPHGSPPDSTVALPLMRNQRWVTFMPRGDMLAHPTTSHRGLFTNKLATTPAGRHATPPMATA